MDVWTGFWGKDEAGKTDFWGKDEAGKGASP
jgi:hypothetical protein